MSDEKRRYPKSQKFRVSFESVFEASAMEGSPVKKFGLTALFPQGTDLKSMEKEAERVLKAEFGEKNVVVFRDENNCWGAKIDGKKIKSPFRDGSEKPELDGYEPGVTFVRFSRLEKMGPPGLVGPDMRNLTRADFYSGCWAWCTWNAFTWEHPTGGKGVSFGVVNIQKVKDDERFAGGTSDVNDDFESVDSEDDELAGLMD